MHSKSRLHKLDHKCYTREESLKYEHLQGLYYNTLYAISCSKLVCLLITIKLAKLGSSVSLGSQAWSQMLDKGGIIKMWFFPGSLL
jgi:hypothetical protein